MNSQAILARMHVFWYRTSGGRFLGRVHGAPILLLTTAGRKTGRERTTPLLYVRYEEEVAVVASNGGRDKDPTWWTNLKHNPNATIQIKGEKISIAARMAAPQEKTELWPILTRLYPQYDEYQKKTSRQIPVVILSASNRPKVGPA